MSVQTLIKTEAINRFYYPEEIKEDFLKTPGLHFTDGSYVDSAQIWDFMTVEGPRRFPYAYNKERNNQSRMSRDVRFFSGIKYGYLNLTLRDRLIKAHENGIPIVHVEGGQTVDPYFAAGAIPIVPGPLRAMARDAKEGLDIKDANRRAMKIMEDGRQAISIECCNNPIGSIEAIHQSAVPVDMVAPYLCLRCTDYSYILEAYRTKLKNTMLHFVDFPVTRDGEWTVTYMAELIRDLVKKLGGLRGASVREEDLWKEIKRENRGRRLARETMEAIWNAEEIPVTGSDIFSIITSGRFDRGDSLACLEYLEQAHEEVIQRVKNGVRAAGIPEKPVRILTVGSCFGFWFDFAEEKGAVLVGTDDHLSKIYADVGEEGDPYEEIAKTILAYDYELPTEQRAQYIIDLVKKTRADGVICGYNWGCNYQSAVSRMIADIVKKESGVPTINLQVAELGFLDGNEQTQNRVEAFIEMLS
ncbi:MAG: 2-hydroxyacyl-CoA dehydratase family protein [Spirochaetales bacterium]|jgi:benzoyl-CoA reductase/2-hydroxyglutaryl-CoA dehydratase subunit BcrC/BadD/HgdB|nr:2-hydroxyacyl-CoA dehydratase family protein [Spirochaetales bacterium]